MTEQTARDVAAKLTKAQREALLEMPTPPWGWAYEQIEGHIRVRLFGLGLLEYLPSKETGAPKMCLTTLGLAVRALTKGTSDAE